MMFCVLCGGCGVGVLFAVFAVVFCLFGMVCVALFCCFGFAFVFVFVL